MGAREDIQISVCYRTLIVMLVLRYIFRLLELGTHGERIHTLSGAKVRQVLVVVLRSNPSNPSRRGQMA